MNIKSLGLIGCILLLAACDESKYDLENLVPQQYHKILYVNNSGKQEATLLDTEDDDIYVLSVIKAGSEPTLSASVDIRLLAQEELDTEYSEIEGVNYKLISDECYSLEATHLDFSSGDHHKTMNISLKSQLIKSYIEDYPDITWTLPLRVTSPVDSINSEMNELVLLLKEVLFPTLGFTDVSLEVAQYNYGDVSTISKSIELGLDTDNKWDIDYELAVDADYITTYNNANGTVYTLFPDATYSLVESATLASGTTTTNLVVTIQGAALEPGDYMLPIRIVNISQFDISSTNDLYPLAIRILGNQFDRTGWTAEANTEEPDGEGAGNGIPECILDGNLGTYWHSLWSGGSVGFPHEIIVDTKEEHLFTQFALLQRQHNDYTDTAAGNFYVSSDKQNWIKVGSFTMEKILDAQVFGVTPTKGRYFKISITESYRDTNTSLSEVYAYGMK